MPENVAMLVAIITGAFLLPGTAAMFSLSNSRLLRYLRSAHHTIWLDLGPHPSSGRNNISAFFRFLSHTTPQDVPDAELWRLAMAANRWLWACLLALVVLVLSILAASLLS
jgi:hypothetical protein